MYKLPKQPGFLSDSDWDKKKENIIRSHCL